MADWKEYKLGDISHILCGATPSTSVAEYWGNEIKWVTAKDVSESNGYKIFDTERKITRVGFENCSSKMLPANTTVLIARGATMGKSCMIGVEMTLNQTCYALIAKPQFLDPYFLFYLVRDLTSHFINISHGAIFDTVIGSSLRETVVIIPDLSEQQAIAEVLSSLDDKIDLLHRQNKTLEALAETLFRQWFVEEAEESWETKTISDVALINQSSIDSDYPFEEIEYLDTGSITDGIVDQYQYLKLRDAPSRAKRIVKDDDIVISLVRPIQRHYGILKRVNPNTIGSTGFGVVSCISIDPHFIYLLLTQKEMTGFLDAIAEGSTTAYPSLKPSDIAAIEFKMPPSELLEQFSAYASFAWKKIESNNNQIRTLMQLRDALLPKLMSGEVRVNQ
jgi:type I restriction enzyme S subunit